METAGADKGYLLLPKEDNRENLWVAAESFGDQQVRIYVDRSEECVPDVSQGVSLDL